MTSTIQPPSTDPGSSSHARFPFVGEIPAGGRQETVLSVPRPADSSSSTPSGRGLEPPPPRSPASLALFPEQRQGDQDDGIAGTTVGHFVIRRRIGAGGMGTVFLADDEKLQRQVALKVLSPQQTADPASVQRFQNEARSAARLDHDHVARVFFYGEEQGLHYIAYEYVHGENLREIIRAQGRLEPAQVVAYAVQLAAALCHTSASGVVHRDIKPSNIIITPQGKAKLVDLGLARKESLEESAQLTVAGTTLGTFDYISPEQAKDPRSVDVRSDIYSLGCTLFHALTGEPPFPEGTVLQRLLDHQVKEPPDPASINRRVSPALSAVVRKMMAPEVRRRYPSAEALLHDLLMIAAAMGLRTLPEGTAASWDSLSRRRNGWTQNLHWLVAAVCLVASAAVWQVYPQLITGQPSPLPTVPFPPPDASTRPAGSVPLDDPNDVILRPSEIAAVITPGEGTSRAEGPSASNGSRTNEAGDSSVTSTTEPGRTGVRPTSDSVPTTTVSPTEMSAAENSVATPVRNGAATGSATGVARGADASTNAAATPDKSSPAAPAAVASSATGNTTTPASDSATSGTGAAVSPPVAAGPFVVLGSGKSYTSLEAACVDVRDQGVIELNFDGRQTLPERPLRVVDKQITVQAARGRRPELWFAPKDGVTDPLQSRMITISGGSMSFINVGLEFQIKQAAPVDLWALFRLERPKSLRLQNVSVTVVNPSHVAAAVVECAAPATTAFTKMGSMKDPQPIVPTRVLIQQCLVRGECNGLLLRDATPVRYEFRQVLFALGEWLLQLERDPDSMKVATDVTVELEHTTCLLGQGLLRSTHEEEFADRQEPIEIVARDNIFSCGPGAALIEQEVPQKSMDFRQSLLQWAGERNRFDATETFWLVRFRSPADETRLGFEDWRGWWGTGEINRSQNAPIVWMVPWRQDAWSKIGPLAGQWESSADAEPSTSILDEPVAGAGWDLLPTPAAPPSR